MKPTKQRKDKRTALEKEIDKHLDAIKNLEIDSEEYQKRLSVIERLTKVKGESTKKPVSPDTIIVAVAGLIQVGWILYREELGHVITSKALGSVMRGRV